MKDQLASRLLNVAFRADSPAMRAYEAAAGLVAEPGAAGEPAEIIAAGFTPRPDLDMTFRGGRTVTDLVFVNQYLGGAAAWTAHDRTSIDRALLAALTDPGLQSVIQQYFPHGPISTAMLPSAVVSGHVPHRFFTDMAEAKVADLFRAGAVGASDPANTIINLMLPRGVVLVDGNSSGAAQRHPALVDDDEPADSTHGLGGFHGSVPVDGTTVYYAVGVFSAGTNGIVAFDRPWKNVVATFYHEVNEYRTDPDVAEVNRTGDMSLLGWYSEQGGEIGDIPMRLVQHSLSEVMKEVTLADGTVVPVQLQWSNHDHGPAASTALAEVSG